MTSDRHDKLIAQLEEIAPEYGRLASQLSDSIATIEERLASLKSKTACQIDRGHVSLFFGRDRDRWTLRVRDRSNNGLIGKDPRGLPLCTAPVEVKTRAVALIEPLIERMLELQRDRLRELHDAATLGAELAKRLNSNPKEGE